MNRMSKNIVCILTLMATSLSWSMDHIEDHMTEQQVFNRGLALISSTFNTEIDLGSFIEQHPEFARMLNNQGKPALYYAVMRNDVAKARVLMNHGADSQLVLAMREAQAKLTAPAFADMHTLLGNAEPDLLSPSIELQPEPVFDVQSCSPSPENFFEQLVRDDDATPVIPVRRTSRLKKSRSYGMYWKMLGGVVCVGGLWWYMSKHKKKK